MDYCKSFKVAKPFLLASMMLATVWSQIVNADSARLPGLVDKPGQNLPEFPTEISEPSESVAPKFEAPADPDAEVATLSSVSFSGDVELDEAELQAVVAPYLNRKLTTYDLASLKYDITAFHYKSGFPLVKISTPPQDLNDGSLEISILMGRVGEVSFDNKTKLKGAIAAAMATRLQQGDSFSEANAESVVQDLNDLPNITARLNLRRGSQPGTTDLRLFIDEVEEDKQQVYIDNYGSTLTGKTVLTADLKKSNLLGLGETLGVVLRKSEDKLKSGQISVIAPIGYGNTKLVASFSKSSNAIGDRLAALQATGESRVFNLGLSGNLINTLQRKVSWGAGLIQRNHKSFLARTLETEDKVSQAYAEASLLVRNQKQVFLGNLRLTKGIAAFGANDKGDAQSTRITGDPRAFILSASAITRYKFNAVGTLTGIFQAQKSGADLLSSDLFSAGGYGSVRGFEPAETSGEHGVAMSVEYSHQLKNTGDWTVTTGPFFDAAWVGNNLPTAATDDHELYAVGLGFEVIRKWNESSSTNLRADWAHPLGSYDSTTVDSNTFYLRLKQTF